MSAFKRFLANFMWVDIKFAPRGDGNHGMIPVMVWDEYYYMRIARYMPHEVCVDIYNMQVPKSNHGETPLGYWCNYAPYSAFEQNCYKGKPPEDFFLTPTKWRWLPRVPKYEPMSHPSFVTYYEEGSHL